MAYGKTILPDQIFQPKVRAMEIVVVFENNIDTIRFGLGVARFFLRSPWIHQDTLFPILMKIEFIEDKYQITIRGIDHVLDISGEMIPEDMVVFYKTDIVIIPMQIVFINMIENTVFVIALLLPGGVK
jgi:hypothetical protein